MENKLKSKELLELFRRGEATAEELKVLYNLMKEEQNPEIISLIDRAWADQEIETKPSLPSSFLQKIHEKAGIKEGAKADTGPIRLVRRVLQYAAIFVIAFLFAWLLKPAASEQQAVLPVEKVSYFRIKVPYGSKSTIELPDSSRVVLNSGSILEYPDRFGETDRTVYLHGEAYFDVARNRQKPFFVKTDNVTIKVLGTKFNVKSYPGEDIMETLLVSGSVEILSNHQVFNNGNREFKRILLKPNEKAVFVRDALSVVKGQPVQGTLKPILKATIAKQKVEATEKDIAWKSDVLILSNEPFSEIVKKLERWYNVKITMDDKVLGKVRFSARFQGESIADVLRALSYTQPFTYEINKNLITIQHPNH